ncbi:MAG: hypothetical protein LBB78_04665, partial [Spirochaetaceae bacterium]|nr:hypothetical protein [Spirochaetaceae bacterium]
KAPGAAAEAAVPGAFSFWPPCGNALQRPAGYRVHGGGTAPGGRRIAAVGEAGRCAQRIKQNYRYRCKLPLL